jgi:hypothetical protein
MCYWILSETGKPIVRSTVQLIPKDNLCFPEVQEAIKALDATISTKLGRPINDKDDYDLDPKEQEHHTIL